MGKKTIHNTVRGSKIATASSPTASNPLHRSPLSGRPRRFTTDAEQHKWCHLMTAFSVQVGPHWDWFEQLRLSSWIVLAICVTVASGDTNSSSCQPRRASHAVPRWFCFLQLSFFFFYVADEYVSKNFSFIPYYVLSVVPQCSPEGIVFQHSRKL